MNNIDCGQINLESYLNPRSFNRIKDKFYIYDKLYTSEFETFKSLQLQSGYGSRHYFDQINLLLEQGLIEDVPIYHDDYQNGKNSQTLKMLGALHSRYQELDKIHELHPSLKAADEVTNFSFIIQAVKERLYAEFIGNKLGMKISPVTSIRSYDDVLPIPDKSDILCVLLDQIPVPDDTVPLAEVIRYKNDESNKRNLLRLKAWVNKTAKSGYTAQELSEEIAWLISEYKEALRLAGLKMKNAKLEFAIKVVPEILENLVKLNLSKLTDPFFRLRDQKLTLLQTESQAIGNELAYIINSLK